MSAGMELNLFTQRRLKRERTFSSDSGCCVGDTTLNSDKDTLDTLLEELTNIWIDKIENVVMGGVSKLKENVCPVDKCKAIYENFQRHFIDIDCF